MPNPKLTYPQQIQELKDQLAQKDAAIEKFSANLELLPVYEKKISELETALAERLAQERQAAVSTKSQSTDIEQRATSAEAGLRNAQLQTTEYKRENEALLQQIEILGEERLKHIGKDEKIIALNQVIQAQNLEITKLNQKISDLDYERSTERVGYENHTRQLRAAVMEKEQQLEMIKNRIREFDLIKSLGQ